MSNNIKIINNISVVPNGLTLNVKALSEGQDCSGEMVTNNLVFGGANSDFSGRYVVDNPDFVDESNLNFNLSSNSPTINNGATNLALAFDFVGVIRIVNLDIGAFEFNSSLSNNVFTNQLQIKHYVNYNQTYVISSEELKDIEVYDTFGKKYI